MMMKNTGQSLLFALIRSIQNTFIDKERLVFIGLLLCAPDDEFAIAGNDLTMAEYAFELDTVVEVAVADYPELTAFF